MSRLPYAAKQLIREVTAIDDRVATTPTEDPDGLGVYRTIGFDLATSKWLAPVIEAVNDPRIAEFAVRKRKLEITFVGDIRADSTAPFDLATADQVLRG